MQYNTTYITQYNTQYKYVVLHGQTHLVGGRPCFSLMEVNLVLVRGNRPHQPKKQCLTTNAISSPSALYSRINSRSALHRQQWKIVLRSSPWVSLRCLRSSHIAAIAPLHSSHLMGSALISVRFHISSTRILIDPTPSAPVPQFPDAYDDIRPTAILTVVITGLFPFVLVNGLRSRQGLNHLAMASGTKYNRCINHSHSFSTKAAQISAICLASFLLKQRYAISTSSQMQKPQDKYSASSIKAISSSP